MKKENRKENIKIIYKTIGVMLIWFFAMFVFGRGFSELIEGIQSKLIICFYGLTAITVVVFWGVITIGITEKMRGN